MLTYRKYLALIFIIVVNNVSIINNSIINPLLVISLDGLRADKFDLFSETKNSFIHKEFAELGVKAQYTIPSFPTVSFPNHFSLVTGLYAENHGIIGNEFYDPNYNEKVNLLYDKSGTDMKWWNSSSPIWLTARSKNLKTGSMNWPGADVWSRNPDIYVPYGLNSNFKDRCDEMVSWLLKFDLDLSFLYFGEPDLTGHYFGSDSAEYNNKIEEMDGIVKYLIERLKAKSKKDYNIIVLSDHGMTQVKPNHTLIVSQYVDLDLIDLNKTFFEVFSNIYPKNESVKNKLFDSLLQIPHLKVYKKEDIPEKFNYKNNIRIAPIVAIADEGYILYTKIDEYPGGHGYDQDLVSMRGIFLAKGPSFKENVLISPIKNVDVYPLLCKLLDLNSDCHPNNGSLENFLPALKQNSSNSSSIANGLKIYIAISLIIALSLFKF